MKHGPFPKVSISNVYYHLKNKPKNSTNMLSINMASYFYSKLI